MTPLLPAHQQRLPILVFILGTSALAVAAWCAGFVTQTAFVWSATIPLDGGWRVYLGQVPHQDFHSPIGYLYLSMIGWMMRLFGPTPDALTQAATLLYLPTAAIAYVLAQRRFSPWLAAAVALLLPAHMVTVTIFGSTGAEGISLGGQYSRIAWGIFMLVPLWAMSPPLRGLSPRETLGERITIGVIIGVLFGIKATYVAGAVAVLALAWVLGLLPGGLGTAAIVGISAVVTVVGSLVATGAPLSGYLADLRIVSQSKSQSLFTLLAAQARRIDLVQIALVATHALIAWPAMARDSARRWLGGIPPAVIGAAGLLVIGHGLSAMNGTEYTSPIWLPALLVVQSAVDRERLVLARDRAWAATALALALVLTAWARISGPLFKGASAWRHPTPPGNAVDSGPWRGRDWVFADHARSTERGLIGHLNMSSHVVFSSAFLDEFRDALRLLHHELHLSQADVVLSLDTANPYSFATGTASPRGDHLYWHIGRNIAARTAPPPEELFRDVTIVLAPRIPMMEETGPVMLDLYGSWLDQHFTRRRDLADAWWTVWERPGRGGR